MGHETDTTIADYVSDLRAPTPSAAAELAVYDVMHLEQTLAGIHGELVQRMLSKIETARMVLSGKELKLRQVHPGYQLKQKQMRLAELSEKLSAKMQEKLKTKRQQTALLTQRLNGLSPMGRLEAG